MSGAIVLRPARPEDGPALIALLQSSFMDTWAPHLPQDAVSRFWVENRAVHYVGEKGAVFFVAEIDGVVAGMVHCDGDFVHALHVLKARRGRGIGRALMTLAEKRVAEAGGTRVRLETDTFNGPSQALYAALGYREIDRYPDQENDPSITTVLLEKLLG